MTTHLCRNVIDIIGQYLHQMKAQFIFEQYCEGIGVSWNNFTVDDLPQFILYLAKKRDNLQAIDDKQFLSMLSNLVNLSNSENGSINRDKKINNGKSSMESSVDDIPVL